MQTTVPSLDLTVPAIRQWEAMNQEQRQAWRIFFQLKPFDRQQLASLRPYAHDYGYHLTDDEIARVVFCLVVELLRYNQAHNMHRAYFGNSGGLDSATTCALLSRARQLSGHLGISFEVTSFGLPISSNPQHNERAADTANTFDVQHRTIERLDGVLQAFETSLTELARSLTFTEEETRRAFGNAKARIRMIVNFFATTKPNSYVVSTDNLSELYMAFWTLMGDVGAFGPIQNILKGLELPSIALTLGVPAHTLDAKPTDGLGVHTSLDEEEGGDTDAFHGVRYPDLDAIICHAVAAGMKLDETRPVRIDAMHIHSNAANEETVNALIAQMSSPASVWKRTCGSIGTAVSREQLGLPSLTSIADRL